MARPRAYDVVAIQQNKTSPGLVGKIIFVLVAAFIITCSAIWLVLVWAINLAIPGDEPASVTFMHVIDRLLPRFVVTDWYEGDPLHNEVVTTFLRSSSVHDFSRDCLIVVPGLDRSAAWRIEVFDRITRHRNTFTIDELKLTMMPKSDDDDA